MGAHPPVKRGRSGTAWARDLFYPPDPYLPPRGPATGPQKGWRPEWDTPERNDADWHDPGSLPPAGKYLPTACPRCGLPFSACVCHHPSARDDWFTCDPSELTPRERARIARSMADRRTWAKDAGTEREAEVRWKTTRFPWLTRPWRLAPLPYDADDARRWDAGRPSRAEEEEAARAREEGRAPACPHRPVGRPMSRPRRVPYPGCVRLYPPDDTSRDARDFRYYYPWGIPTQAVTLWHQWAANREALRREYWERQLDVFRMLAMLRREVTDADREGVARQRELAAREEVLDGLADWAARLRRDAAKGRPFSHAYRVALGGVPHSILLRGGERDDERGGVLRRLEQMVARRMSASTLRPLPGGGLRVGRENRDRYVGRETRPPFRLYRAPMVAQPYTTWLDVAPFAEEIAPRELPTWLTVKEVAALVGVSDTAVYKWVERSGVPSLPSGGRGGGRVYRGEDVEAWAAQRQRQQRQQGQQGEGQGQGQGRGRLDGAVQGQGAAGEGEVQPTTVGQSSKVVGDKFHGSGDAA